jgi:hypothetical protein
MIMKRVLRIPRFNKEGKPKTLELLMDSPNLNEKGFPQEARLLLVIDDGKIGLDSNSPPLKRRYSTRG